MMKLFVFAMLLAIAAAMCQPRQIATLLRQTPNLKKCKKGEKPKFKDCGPSCNPFQTTIKEAKLRCTKEVKKACVDSIKAGLPTCGVNVTKSEIYNSTICCANCKPNLSDIPKPSSGKCSKNAYAKCRTKTDVCQPGETPQFFEGSCCTTCTRPGSSCSKKDIFKCMKDVPVCAEDEDPISITDGNVTSCCPSCRPGKPSCTCAGGSCGRKSLADPVKCLKKQKKRLEIKAKSEAMNAILKEADSESLQTVILDVVERFCDKIENEERCLKFKQIVMDTLNVTIIKKEDVTGSANETATVDISVADDTEVQGLERAFFLQEASADDGSAFVNSALNSDDDLASTEQATVFDPNAPVDNGASGLTASPLFALLLLALLF